jgi:hypothetical protein
MGPTMTFDVQNLPPAHVVEVMCRCPDPDTCVTNDLVADRNTGWKEYFRLLKALTEVHEGGQ